MNTTGLWLIPADSNILADSIQRDGYDGLYRDHCDPAMKAATKLGERVDAIWERFPFTPYGRTKSASLLDFVNAPWTLVNEWTVTVRRITMPSLSNPAGRKKYVAYLRPFSDIASEPGAFREIVSMLTRAAAVAAVELSGDSFSIQCLLELNSYGLLYAVEPAWEVGLPQLHNIPIITAQTELERAQAAGGWPRNWLPLGAGQPSRHLIATDEPWTPQWSRLARATGYKPLVMPHRFVEAAR